MDTSQIIVFHCSFKPIFTVEAGLFESNVGYLIPHLLLR